MFWHLTGPAACVQQQTAAIHKKVAVNLKPAVREGRQERRAWLQKETGFRGQALEKAGEWARALRLLARMERAHVPPDVISYNAGISACAQARTHGAV